MEIPAKLQNSLDSFFKRKYKVTKIERQLTQNEILVVVDIHGLKAQTYLVVNLKYDIKYIL